MDDNMRTSLVRQTIDMAARRCPIEKDVTIFCSNRGSQYAFQKFLNHLKTYEIRSLVGHTGVCWTMRLIHSARRASCYLCGCWRQLVLSINFNACTKSFDVTLKNERLHRMAYPTKDKAISYIA